MLNPVLNPFKNFYFYLTAWSAATLAHAFVLHHFYVPSFATAFADALFFNFSFAAIGIGIWYPCRYLRFDYNSILNIVTNHMMAGSFILLVWIQFNFSILRLLIPYDIDYQVFLESSIPLRIIQGMLYYLIVILFYYLFIYYVSSRENLLKASELRTKVKETQLELLKAQLNPHFIFNSLNSISALTITNPARAQEMVVKLSTFLRYSIAQKSDNLVSLSDELQNCLLYLDIEKVRFGDRLQLTNEITEACNDFLVPELILQPLIENAIKHGVHESSEPVSVKLSCITENEILEISITNSFDPEYPSKTGKGLGLKSVIERLHLLYGRGNWLYTEKQDNEFTAILRIPKNLKKEDED